MKNLAEIRLLLLQVNRLIHELQSEGTVRVEGYGRGAKYVFAKSGDN